MKANELESKDLMIGDLVYACIEEEIVGEAKYKIISKIRVLEANGDLSVEFVGEFPDEFDWQDGDDIGWAEPIPITPEILNKNFRGYKRGSGALTYFVYELNEDYFIRAGAGDIDLCMHYDDSEHAAHDDIYLVELKYVHTLQHALRLFGFDKEIVL